LYINKIQVFLKDRKAGLIITRSAKTHTDVTVDTEVRAMRSSQWCKYSDWIGSVQVKGFR